MSANDQKQKPAAEDGFWHNGSFFAWAPPVTKPPPARIPTRLVVAAILHDPTKDGATDGSTTTNEKATTVEVPPLRPATTTVMPTPIPNQHPESTSASQTTEPNTFVSHNGHTFAWAPPVTKQRQPDRATSSQSSPTPSVHTEHSFSHNGHSYAWASSQSEPQSKPDTNMTGAFSHNGHSFAWAPSETNRQSDFTSLSSMLAMMTPLLEANLRRLRRGTAERTDPDRGLDLRAILSRPALPLLTQDWEETSKVMDELAPKNRERRRKAQDFQQEALDLDLEARARAALAVPADPLPLPLPRNSPPRRFKDFQDELVEARRLAVSSITRSQDFSNCRIDDDLHQELRNLRTVPTRLMGERRPYSRSYPQHQVDLDRSVLQAELEPLPNNATIEPPKDLPSRYSTPKKTDKPQGDVPSRYVFTADPVANPKSVVKGQGHKGHYRFSVLTDKLVRFEWSEDGGFEDRASTTAFFRSFPTPEFKVDNKKNQLEIVTKYFHLTYDKNEFSSDGLTIKAGNDVWHYDGKSYGDLGGTARTLDRADGRIPLEPGVLSRKAYAVLDDSASMLFEDGWIATRKPGRKDGYLFAYHGDHKAAIKDFYRLSGGQPLLPRWALGNWWSRYHAYSDKEYLAVMKRFANETIPLSVAVIDMDWHKVNIPSKYGSGWTGYSWNPDLFPFPENFLDNLHNMGLKVTVNDHPADGIRAFEDQYKVVAEALGHDTSNEEPIRFDCTDKKFLDAYFDVLKANLEDEGIDFWWIDWQQGNRSRIPGVDPLWVLNHYHYLTSRRNVKTTATPITFSRYAGAGSHRYPIGFSGDTLITWASLHFQPEFTATASNIGYGWWSHDIGGHYAGVRSNELTARWVQFGCFSPILRLHSEKSQWNSKEPWLYEPEARKVMTNYMQLRYRLIPFLYTMNVRACYESEPLMQPMYWNHKDDEEAYTVPNQYYFGPDLIVAPITTPNDSSTLMGSVRAWLPDTKGRRYIDIRHPSLVYDGGRYVDVHRPLSEIPVFAREGTIIPLDTAKSPGRHKNGVTRPQAITIQLVVGADAYFELVEEPTDAVPAAKADRPDPSTFVRTPIRWNQKEGILAIGPEVNGRGERREWTVELLGCTKGMNTNFSEEEAEGEDHCALPMPLQWGSPQQDLDRLRQKINKMKLHNNKHATRPRPNPNLSAYPSGIRGYEPEPHAEHSTRLYLGTIGTKARENPFAMYQRQGNNAHMMFAEDRINQDQNQDEKQKSDKPQPEAKAREFNLGKNLELDVVDIPARLHQMLYRCEMEYPMKQIIYDLVTKSDQGSVKERVERLWRLGNNVPESVKRAVVEIWAADSRSEGNAVGVACKEVVEEEEDVKEQKKDDGKEDEQEAVLKKDGKESDGEWDDDARSEQSYEFV
ncbi:glycosyl hydrolases family 31-domain-containing protein [Copromyces sp. CBS 386.78]|nr:glycosyl hydrolases family 31-domain-containing protein [Copromyces sp. CBS 386.78]